MTIHTEQPEPPTPSGASARPTAAPCKLCGTTEGYFDSVTGRYYRGRGLCGLCHSRERNAGRLETWPLAPYVPVIPQHPAPLRPIITPAMLGISRQHIAANLAHANAVQRSAEALCLARATAWRERHPEQFTPSAMEALFERGDVRHARFYADAAQQAA